MSIAISPSILNYDFGHLADELAKVSNAGSVHVDIMDNYFIPNPTLGLPLAEAAVKSNPIPTNTHLMIEDLNHRAPVYVELGYGFITFHAEVAQAPIRLAREIQAMGRRVGLALRPATGIEPYLDILGEFGIVLVMTVGPGFGGQSLIEAVVLKISRTRQAIEVAGLDVWIQADDGISRLTTEKAVEAEANNSTMGSAVYKADGAAAEADFLRSLASKHCC